jgi:hypothetical protein
LFSPTCNYNARSVENGVLNPNTSRVWKFDEANRCWQQIAAMPVAISNEWFGKKPDINCVGAGSRSDFYLLELS